MPAPSPSLKASECIKPYETDLLLRLHNKLTGLRIPVRTLPLP